MRSPRSFHRRQVPHRVIGRSRKRLETAFGGTAEVVSGDIGDVAAAQRALRGVQAGLYCVGLPYPEHARHPVLFQSVVEAAQRERVARLALVSSVYPYGRRVAGVGGELRPADPACCTRITLERRADFSLGRRH